MSLLLDEYLPLVSGNRPRNLFFLFVVRMPNAALFNRFRDPNTNDNRNPEEHSDAGDQILFSSFVHSIDP